MTRLVDALQDGAHANGSLQPMINLASGGGYNGWSPDLAAWHSNAADMRGQLHCILLDAPKFFSLMPQPEKWVECLKNLFEVHMKTWEGFNGTLKADFEEHDVGGAGEKHQEVANVTRERTVPTSTFIDKYGNPGQTLLYNWIIYGMMDPDAKYAMVSTLPGERPTDLLPDWSSASALFYEADPLHRRVVRSWVVVNMMPQSSGEITGRRDLSAGRELNTVSVEWTGIAQFNLGGSNFAQGILDTINITNAVPHLRPSFVDKISADVEAAQVGFKVGAEDLGTNHVPGLAG